MERLGAAARARTDARVVAVTGSVGKTSAKEMLRQALGACGATHASAASYNNHWGVPLTLARMPAETRFGVFEIGMNHAGEIAPLTRMARPHVALVTTIAPVHIEHLGSLEAIADAKAEIFLGLEPGGVAVLNRDAPQFERLDRAAGVRARQCGRSAPTKPPTHGSSGSSRPRAARGSSAYSGPSPELRYRRAGTAHGGERARRPARRAALGADVEACAAALAGFAPQKGSGARLSLTTPDGSVTVIDESYNANPASMRAALTLLGAAKPGPSGRRIAVIGDMLELGPDGAALHAALAADLAANEVDLLFGAGPLTRALYDAAPPSMRAAWAEQLGRAHGENRRRAARRRRRHGQGVERQPDGAAGRGAARAFRAGGREARTSDADLAGRSPALPGHFHLFRYLTFRTLGAAATGLFLVFFFGPTIISALRLKQGKGQPIRADGPASHLLTKKGTPTMGGLMILFGLFASALLWANLESPYVWIVLFVTFGFAAIGFYDDYLKVTKQSHLGLFRPRASGGRIRHRGSRLLRADAGRRRRRDVARAALRQRLRRSISAGAFCCSARS